MAIKTASKPTPNLWVWAFDIHYPKVDKPTFNAMMDFVQRNKDKIAGFGFGGDQLDNAEISHFNSSKPLYKPTGSYDRNTRGFDADILQPIEASLPEDAARIWIEGNHDNWEHQLIEHHPEMQGTIERRGLLNLDARGWQFVCCGTSYRLGKLTVIHGETLSGIGNQAPGYHAKKAVETYAGNILFGHMHVPQTFTKVLPHDVTQKWQAQCSPILGSVNPAYIRNRPHAWLNGFTIVEISDGGIFNMYPVIVSRGRFSFGGIVYGRQ